MNTILRLVRPLAAILIVLAGCDAAPDDRLLQMAEEHLERQAEQERRVHELQHEVAEGARQLVEADAAARIETISLQRELQGEQAEIGRQRDSLEQERRDVAASRRWDSLLAAVLTNVGFLVACLLPLVLAGYLLVGSRVDTSQDQAIAELLLEDLVSDTPRLTSVNDVGALPQDDGPSAPRLGGRDNSDNELTQL